MYDALLLLSFGGPEAPDDVMPFLENVTRGRNVPPERLAAVAEHYRHFGGVSPINQQNRALLAAVQADFAAHGIRMPVYWGNRNWAPYLADTIRAMAADEVRHGLVFVTSAYASYSACRQYQDDLVVARNDVGSSAPTLDKLRHFFDHPGFIEPQRDSVAAAIGDLAPSRRPTTRLLFVAHSIPVTMAAHAGPNGGLYVEQLRAASALVAEAAPGIEWELVYSSRSGPPSVAWLEPDINDRIRELAMQGVTEVVAVPVGFVSDHIEVRWDLDVEAAATAREVGVTFRRTDPPSADPRFVGMVRELVVERLDAEAPVRALSSLGPSYDVCPTGCCRHPEPG